MGYDKVKTIVEHVASLQAYGFQHPELLGLIPPLDKDPYENLLSQLPVLTKQIRELHPGRLTYTDEQLDTMLCEVQKYILVIRSMDRSQFTPVISLSDMQPNNILWKLDAQGNLTNEVAAFIDFQMCHSSHCLLDLVLQFVLQLTPQERRQRTDELLQHYLNLLDKQSGGKGLISPTEVNSMMKKMLLQFGLVIMTFAAILPDLPESTGLRKGRDLDWLDRSLAALDDATKNN